MKKITFSIFLLAFCTKVLAQNTPTHIITLDESKRIALNYSNNIKNSNLSIQSAEEGKINAQSNYLPNVSGTGVAVYGIKDFVSAIPPYLNNNLNNFYFVGATAIEPIYQGGKIKTGNDLAQLQLEVSKIRANQSKDSVLLMTEKKYWNIVNLQEQYKSILSNEILLNAILKQQNDLLKQGLIAKNDLLKVKVKLSQLLLNKSKLDNGKKLAIFDFCLYVGYDYDSNFVMVDTFQHLNPPEKYLVDPEVAVTQNDNYHLLQQNMTAQKLQTKMAKADFMPSFNVGLTAGQSGSINNSALNKFLPMAFGTLNIPISGWIWGGAKSKIAQQKIAEQVAENNYIDGTRQLRVGILKNWYDLKDAYKQIDFANENLTQATENLKVNQDNYSSGLASITELLDAQTEYQQAAGDKVTALANYQEKMADYQYIIGAMGKK